VKALKAAVAPRRTNGASKGSKAGKGRHKANDAANSSEGTAAVAALAATAALEASRRESRSWGVFEPFHRPFGPILTLFQPFWNPNFVLGIIGILSLMVVLRSLALSTAISSNLGYPGLTMPQRIAAYEEMWRSEESELWNWLEERIGLEGLSFASMDRRSVPQARHGERQKGRVRDFTAILNEEQMAEREIDYAIKVTRGRLEVLEEAMRKRRPHNTAGPQRALTDGDYNGGANSLSEWWWSIPMSSFLWTVSFFAYSLSILIATEQAACTMAHNLHFHFSKIFFFISFLFLHFSTFLVSFTFFF
jgi:hypothetical protein